VGKVEVSFLVGPAPEAVHHLPSSAFAAEKAEFGASRRARWFGLHPPPAV
jgi:sulfide:quinone oxidoreductase